MITAKCAWPACTRGLSSAKAARWEQGRRRWGSALQCGTALPPSMLGILALELLLDLGVTLAPEGLQVAGDLDRPMVRRQDLNAQRHPAPADAEPARRVVQILNACGDRRRGSAGVGDFRGAPTGQFHSFRRQVFQGLLLTGVQPRFHAGPD